MCSPDVTTVRRALVCLAFGLSAATVSGHAVSVTRGTMVVSADSVHVEFDVAGDTMLHTVAPGLASEAVVSAGQWDQALQRYGEYLRDALIIRDQHGRRLSPTGPACDSDMPMQREYPAATLRGGRVTSALRYALAEPSGMLILQQGPGPPDASHRSQMVLAVTTGPATPSIQVRLTSGGNTQVLKMDRSGGRDVLLLGPEQFERVSATLDVAGGVPTLQVRIPMHLITTWAPMAVDGFGQFSEREQMRALACLHDLLNRHVVLRIEGRTVQPIATSERIEPMTASPDPGDGGASDCLWTTWACAQVRYPVSDPSSEVELEWGLFNGAVLAADVVIRDGRHAAEAQLTAYAPTLRWEP